MTDKYIHPLPGDQHDQTRDALTMLRRFLKITPMALSLVRGIEGELFSRQILEKPILDIGCGDGLFMANVYDEKLDAGIDISATEVARARRRGNYEEVVLGSVDRIPYPNNTFKTVVSNCVLEHIRKPEEAFIEIHRVMQPGGKYLFTAHSDLYEDYLFFPRLFSSLGLTAMGRAYSTFLRKMFKHFSCLSPETWSGMLQRAGFTRIKYEYYLPKRTLETFDMLLPFSTFAYVNKKLFGRWVITPRNWVWPIFGSFLKERYQIECPLGGALFIVAYKD